MHQAIAYGDLHGRIVHIDEVPSGLACNCRCLNCSAQLIARKGPIRADHFAHRAGAECQGLAEGALHRLAKEILCTASHVWIPAYRWSRTAKLPDGAELTRDMKLTHAGTARILEHHREYRGAFGFIPDVRLRVGSATRTKDLFVEIVVTHPIDRRKRRLIRKHGVPTIEIQLEADDLRRSWEELRQKLLGQSAGKRWVFHPAQVKHELTFVKAWREAYQLLRRRPQRRETIRGSIIESPVLRPLPAPRPSMTMAQLRQHEADVEAFNRKQGRYPSLEETKRLFRWRR